MRTFDNEKPEIRYPCAWSYRLIGVDEARLRAVVREIMGDLEHTLSLANESSKGHYRSMALETVVRDEAQRLAIFESLSRHPDVRFVF